MRVVLYRNQHQKQSSSSSSPSSASFSPQHQSSSGCLFVAEESSVDDSSSGEILSTSNPEVQQQSVLETDLSSSSETKSDPLAASYLANTNSAEINPEQKKTSKPATDTAISSKSIGEITTSVACANSNINSHQTEQILIKKSANTKRKAFVSPAGRKTTGILPSVSDTKPQSSNKKLKTTKHDSKVAATPASLPSAKSGDESTIDCTEFEQQQQKPPAVASKHNSKMVRIPDKYDEQHSRQIRYSGSGCGDNGYGDGGTFQGSCIDIRSQISSDFDEVMENDPVSASGEYNNNNRSFKNPAFARRQSYDSENDLTFARGGFSNNYDNIHISKSNENENYASAKGGVCTYSQFQKALKERGLEIREQEGDGNCLFRSVSLQVYGDASMHGEIRKRCLDFMARDEEHFSHFVTGEPFKDYIERKRQNGVHGNNPEIQAISELFNRPVEVFVEENGAKPINIFHAEYKTADTPIRLSYHDGNHYNAVIDPLCPTAGLGLGLPGLQPGLADRMQMEKAKQESDRLADEAELERAREASYNDHLQRALKDSNLSVDQMYKNKAMALSDLEATEIEMEQAMVASSLESYQQSESARKPSSSRRRQNGRNSPPSRMKSTPVNTIASSAAATIPTHASASSAASAPSAAFASGSPGPRDEYPQTVQELVMNGFELSKVVKAYELVGDSFDDMLAFLMSSTR